MPKLEYPAFFQGDLLGVKIKEDIQHNESFLSVPMRCQITVNKALKVPELKKIFDEHPDMFDEDENGDFEHHILETFIIYEMQKGEDSFWHAYFEVLPRVTHFWLWDEEIIR